MTVPRTRAVSTCMQLQPCIESCEKGEEEGGVREKKDTAKMSRVAREMEGEYYLVENLVLAVCSMQ